MMTTSYQSATNNLRLPDWRSLSLKQQIGQTIVVRASGFLFDHQIRYPAWEATNNQLKQWLAELNLGGVILLGGSSIELQARSQQLQSWAQIPLFLAADVEEGLGQRFPGGTWFPPPMACGAIAPIDRELARQYARTLGQITAIEAVAVGLNWLLAPVVDVNNNSDNPVINIRAFSDRPEVVSELAAAFIEGAKSSPILTTAKHFPGHGDTATDSHLNLPTVPHDGARLAEIELPPFQDAIAAGVDSVMTAHLLIPAWDEQRPATLSPQILEHKLRQQLGFDGLIVTDALIMGGITQYAPPAEVAVMAIEAGNDILLMPDNPEVAIAAIYDAVKSGRISEERIQASLQRIWRAKTKIIPKRSLNRDNLATTTANSTVSSILRDSLKTGGNFPFHPQTDTGRNLIVVDDLLNAAFLDLHTPAVTLPQQFNYQRQIVDRHTLKCILGDSRPTLLQVFIRGNPFRGNAGLTPQAKSIYRQLLETGTVEALIIYGSPYVMDWFATQLNDGLPWVFTYGQMPVAQAIALDTLFQGKAIVQPENKNLNFGF
jgi:beta-glucosidase